jgi:anti-anti-sigma factor
LRTEASVKAELEATGALAILRFAGDISSTSRDAVLGAWENLPRDSVRNILLDFTKVDYLNSSGLALVIQMLMEANKSGQKVRCFGLTPHFQKVFRMVGIAKYAEIHPDEAAARRDL